MEAMKELLMEEEPLSCPLLAMYFLQNSKELAFCRPHFHNGQEYIWIRLLHVIKSYDIFSFQRCMDMLKVYLSLWGRVVEIKLDLHEVNHEINIIRGQMVETIKDISATQEAIELFCRVFEVVNLHSLYMDKYVYLKARAIQGKKRNQQERELTIRRRLLEAHEAALNARENEAGGPWKYILSFEKFRFLWIADPLSSGDGKS